MTYEKVSLSMPADLAAALDRRSRESGVNRSQEAVTMIRQALTSELQQQALSARIAELETELQWAALSPTSFPDFLTKAPAGTDRLRRDIDFLQRKGKELQAEIARRKTTNDVQDRKLAALQQELDSRSLVAATNLKLVETLRGQLAEQQDCVKEYRDQLAMAGADRRSRRVTVPVPILLPRITRPAIDRPNFRSAMKGAVAFAAALLLGLVFVPYETWLMRSLAMGAMGTWNDAPAAAARLHGGPVGGHDTLLQIYTLMKAGRNAQRLDHCFELSRNTPPRKAVAIDCTIKVPSEFELYSTLVVTGPHSSSSRGKRTLENAQRQLDALQRLDRAEQ